MKGDSQKNWLVKSSGRVVGPYTLDEIEQALMSREFVLLDEVACPFRRFKSFREWPEFAEITERLRQRQRLTGDDLTSTVSVMSTTVSQTAPLPIDFKDEMTDDLGSLQQEVVIDSIEEEVIGSQTNSTAGQSRFQTKTQAQKSLTKQDKNWGRWMMATAFTVALVGLFFYYFDQINTVILNPPVKAEDLLEKGYTAIDRGNLGEAWRIFKELTDLQPTNPDVIAVAAPLSVYLKGETTIARRLISQLGALDSIDDPSLLSTLGLSYLKDGNLSQAENYFDRVLEKDHRSVPALFNLGVLHFRAKRWVKSKNFFVTAADLQPDEEAPLLYLALTHVQNTETLKDQNDLIIQRLEKFLESQKNGYHAVSLLLAHLYLESGLNDQAEEVLNRALLEDPYLDHELTHNIFLETEEIEWRRLEPICKEVVGRLSNQALGLAFQSICQVRSEDVASAVTSIQKALDQSPRDEVFWMTASYVYDRAGQSDKKTLSLNRLASFSENRSLPILSMILQARHLENSQDFDGAYLLWQKVLLKDLDSLPAMVSRARRAMRAKNDLEFEKHKNEIIKYTDRYIPMRELIVENRQAKSRLN